MAHGQNKGKIAHSSWEKIVSRYEGGDTIAQIFCDYGCTAPAIRYIIRKSGKLRDYAGPRHPVRSRSAIVPESKQQQSAVGYPTADAVDQTSVAIGRSTPLRTPYGNPFGLEMRRRVTGDLAAFYVAFDQVSADDPGSLNSLLEATDRLMRAAARTRIELEQLLGSSIGEERGASRRRASPEASTART